MAWDHTLALELPPGRGVVRLYRWVRPTLSLGRHEPARGVIDPARVAEGGVDLVRRPTGGRTVLHHEELTYAVVAPLRALGGAREGYARINRGLAEGLAALGLPVALAEAGRPVPPDAGACFREPAEGEVVAAGRKLVGSAQLRVGPNLLQHGSILMEDGQARIDEFRVGLSPATESVPVAGPGSRGRGGVRGLSARSVAVEEVVEAVSRGLRGALEGDWRPTRAGASLEEADLPSDPAPELLARYRSPEWSWRR
jgi:lipoate-protein ligase A